MMILRLKGNLEKPVTFMHFDNLRSQSRYKDRLRPSANSGGSARTAIFAFQLPFLGLYNSVRFELVEVWGFRGYQWRADIPADFLLFAGRDVGVPTTEGVCKPDLNISPPQAAQNVSDGITNSVALRFSLRSGRDG